MPKTPSHPPQGFVRVRGAREHNLKNVDVDIPRDALVVFTGISGSGKSSLAFGTLYAEAQRRYLESVAPYARRLIDQAGTPDVDRIDGLPPAVALQQQRGTPTARSSVGTATAISSLLRLLYSRAGHYPPGQPMLYAEDFSPNTPEGACPHCHGMGRVYEVTERSLVPDDSLTIRERAVAAWPTAWGGQNLRDILTTLGHDVDLPWRALPKKTRDWILFTDEQPVVPVYVGFDRHEAKAARKAGTAPSYMGTFTSARRHVLHSFAHSKSARMRERAAAFLVGSPCPACGGRRLKPEALSVTFAGHDIAALGRLPLDEVARLLQPAAEGRLGEGQAGRAAGTGRAGARSHRAHTASRVAAGGSAHAAAPDVRRTPDFSAEKVLAAQRLAQEIGARIAALAQLGLGYLTLDRATPSLSSGELQRLRLATQLGSQLFGVVYVLDEPSAGLHPADGEALLDALHRLKAAGNSLFVVEHDLGAMRHADWLVDVGPGAGTHGGEVLYSGPPAGLAHVAQSQTRRYLFPAADVAPRPVPRAPRVAGQWLRLEGIVRHNLQGADAAFPVGCLTAVTGVSGSGKSSLVSQALVALVAAALGTPSAGAAPAAPDAVADGENDPAASRAPSQHALQDDDPGAADDAAGAPLQGRLVGGLAGIRRLVQVDQKPIGRTPRSNLATYTGLFDGVRQLFAATPAARRRRYGPGRFSFNVAQGRCPTCEGEGFVSVELLFLPSVYAPCPDCHGARYNPDTLQIQWNGLNIAQVLALTVDSACAAFADEPAVLRPLVLLRDIGLGYLRLGQPATELSGGEAQRIKLATELQRLQRGDTLYVLDEPTTGLHPADVDRLLVQLDGLAAAGNTVVVVEHDMRVAAACDWVIDMGPGAGAAGGQVVACGTPAEVAGREADSRTARYLARALAGEPGL
ncbi:excinuclease ABC subunit A [Pseudorhodoferax sp. Leaf274]|nr:excinuclease ABC subunit A [Pseudorhodoferax sp. Leaf274]